MIEYIVPLIEFFLPIWDNYLVYVFALGFISWVPCFILSFFRR